MAVTPNSRTSHCCSVVRTCFEINGTTTHVADNVLVLNIYVDILFLECIVLGQKKRHPDTTAMADRALKTSYLSLRKELRSAVVCVGVKTGLKSRALAFSVVGKTNVAEHIYRICISVTKCTHLTH